jgi:hypothetical protein
MTILNKKHLMMAAILLASLCVHAQNDSLTGKHPLQASGAGQSDHSSVVSNPDLKGNGIKRFLVGRNYRKEWTTPVHVPTLDLRKEGGGMTPKKEGGGKETRSLQVEDASGTGWALRSIRKYPDKAIPDELKNTVAEEIVSDDISASYPFGVLSIGILSEAAEVPYLKNRLFYLPDDPALGKYREKYGNSLVLMEEREPNAFFDRHKKGHPKLKSISTEEMLAELYKSGRNRVNQLAVLRARLLDNFVMDFDRHEGQWNWVGFDSAGLTIYYPVPKDRDQVFYTNQGLIPKFMRGKERLPELQGFKAKVEHPNTFNRTARNFDRTFLTGMTEEDWSREIDHFLEAMTDSVIDAAMAKQPAELLDFSAKDIAKTLKKKRKYFRDDMLRYYHSLSSNVGIVGTNENDVFTITKEEDGHVLVVLQSAEGSEMYRRRFDPEVTQEIDLYGLEGNDRFSAEGGKAKIKIRMVGGPGQDSFVNNGNGGKMVAYDVSFEENKVDKGFTDRIKADPLNNTYTRLGYAYKVTGIGPAVEFTPSQGLFLGLKFKILTPGFRVEPYHIRQVFSVTHSINSSSFHFRYDADFIQSFGRTDLLIRGDLMMPTNRTNFFGYGNNTLIDEKKFKHNFYHAHYDIGNIALLARTHVTPSFNISYGPAFQYFNLREEENEGRYVKDYFATSPTNSYAKKFYAGGEARVSLITRNDPSIPTRGVVLTGYARVLKGLNSASSDVTQTGGSLSAYADFGSRGRVVLAALVGGGHNAGHFEIGQAQYLGFTDHLRGYRLQRFAGRSSAYSNTELRFKIADIHTWLFPTILGIYTFHDVGRVWMDGEKSNTWHRGYGGGLWIAPFSRLVFTAYVSYSTEEKALPWATIGFVF